jgi:hypothetical protein
VFCFHFLFSISIFNFFAVGSHTNLRAVGWGITGVYPRAVGSHANLRAVGGGLRGTESPVGVNGDSVPVGGKWGAQPPIKLKRFNLHK